VKVLVTGATSFVGRALVTTLRNAAHEVRTLVLRATDARNDSEAIVGDLSSEASVARATQGVEVVFHCARSEDAFRGRRALEALNLVGTENVLAACRATGVRRVVFLSSANVTRGTDARNYVDEDLPQPARFLDDAAETLALAEDLVVAASDAALSTVTLRPGWLWGVGDTWLAARVVRGSRHSWRWIDDGRALCATTNITNLTSAFLLAATTNDAAGGVYYLTDDERTTVREFLTRLAGALGVTLSGGSTPYALAYVMAWLRGAPHRSEVVAMGRSTHFNIQRARTTLGYAPVVDITEGMRQVAQWARAVGLDAIAAGEHVKGSETNVCT
jgi:nucleoside-diphosphate-sugar epimerase